MGWRLVRCHSRGSVLRRSGYPGDLPVRRGRSWCSSCCRRVPALRVVSACATAFGVRAGPSEARAERPGPALPVRARRPARQGRLEDVQKVFTGTVAGMTAMRGESREPSRWTIHDEWLVDNTRRLDLRLAHVELPDGVHFEQYVFRMPKAAMTVVLDDVGDNVLMIYRHRFIMDRWTWELPGGYVDPHESPALCAAREVEEETGWRPRSIRLLTSFQPMAGTADFENLLFVADGAERASGVADINEAARVEWLPLDSIRQYIARGEIIGAAAQIGLLHVLVDRLSCRS